jgi:hypothetical protein
LFNAILFAESSRDIIPVAATLSTGSAHWKDNTIYYKKAAFHQLNGKLKLPQDVIFLSCSVQAPAVGSGAADQAEADRGRGDLPEESGVGACAAPAEDTGDGELVAAAAIAGRTAGACAGAAIAGRTAGACAGAAEHWAA